MFSANDFVCGFYDEQGNRIADTPARPDFPRLDPRLAADFLQLHSEFLRLHPEICSRPNRGSSGGESDADRIGRLTDTWHEVWVMLNDLLDGRDAYPMFGYSYLRLTDGAVHQFVVSDELMRIAGEDGYRWLLMAFDHLLRARSFPFARCPACRRIFVRVRRQRYCSPTCASRAHEAARKDTKREYMRKYMAMRRAKARKAQRKGR